MPNFPFLVSDSAMARRIRQHDWSATALPGESESTVRGETEISFLLGRNVDGAQVAEPTNRGFGSRIIAMGLGGTVESEFKSEGLVVRIEASIAFLQHV
jgi:hypothetical protein